MIFSDVMLWFLCSFAYENGALRCPFDKQSETAGFNVHVLETFLVIEWCLSATSVEGRGSVSGTETSSYFPYSFTWTLVRNLKYLCLQRYTGGCMSLPSVWDSINVPLLNL